ncbi:MAG: hypothetical protein ABS98_06345 [Lysobacteraceae bacterium SCN 69-48]|nr:MAG: hypothetical protein ABS98_06345 [Xanthomonadaceae bacterium SCN 69-48]
MITMEMSVPGGTRVVTITETADAIVVESGLSTAKKKKRQETPKANLTGSVEDFIQDSVQSHAVAGYEMVTATPDTGEPLIHMAGTSAPFDPAKLAKLEEAFGLSPAKPGVADRMRWAIGHVTVSASKATNGDRTLSFSSTRSRGYQAAAFVLLWSPATKVFAGNDEVQVHDYLNEGVRAKAFKEEVVDLLYEHRILRRPFNISSLPTSGHGLALAM